MMKKPEKWLKNLFQDKERNKKRGLAPFFAFDKQVIIKVVQMGLTVLKKDLKKILKWLLTQLTEEDMVWLLKHKGVFWKDYQEIHSDSWWDMYADLKHEISFRIHDIIQTKDKTKKDYGRPWAGGLAKYYVVRVAELLNIECLDNKNKTELLNDILSKIP